MLKNIMKRTVSTLLVLTMVVTMFSIIEIVEPQSVLPTASAGAWDKTYTKEYYGTATTFYGYLAVAWKSNSLSTSLADQTKALLTDSGYSVFNKDLNDGAGGDYIYMGYKTTSDVKMALRRVCFGQCSNDTKTYNSVTYYTVGKWHGSEANTMSVKDKYVDGVHDLNSSAGGADIYTYATRDSAAGGPITSMEINSTSSGGCVWLYVNGYDSVGDVADLNRGAGGDDIKLHHSTSYTEVNTSTMRSYMNTYAGLTSSNYTSDSWSDATTAFNTCKTIAEDYNADGVSTSKNSTSISNAATALNSALTALYTTITINGNGGTPSNTSTNIKCGTASSVNFPTGSFTATRTGYDFKGWSTSSSATSGTSSGNLSVSLKSTVYAVWKAHTYTVAYNGNGATSGSTASSSHTYGTAKALTANGYSRSYTVTYNYNGSGASNTTATASYSFNGWNTNSSGTGTSYSNQQSVSNLTSTDGATVTLYAKWTGGSVTTPSPTYTGYTFGGWYGESGCSTFVVNGSTSYTPGATKTLYAKWTINTSTLKVNPNGGTWAYSGTNYTSTQTYTKNYNTTMTIGNPTRTGYNFTGWTRTGDNNGSWNATTGVYTFGATAGKTDTLTAAWSDPISYSITYYDSDGTTALSLTPSSYNVTTASFNLPTPTKTGYDFTGWTGSNGSSAQMTVTISQGTTGNKSYTAHWSGKTYSITFDPKYYSSSGATGVAVTSNGTTSTTATYGSAMPAITPPTYTGYTFKGYYDTKTGTGTQYYKADGSSNRSWNKTSATTLYAKWDINSYTLTVKPNGGSFNSTTNDSTFTQNYGTTKTIGAATRTGYSFTGWTLSNFGFYTANTDATTGGTYTYGAGAGTLTAGWSIHRSTLTVNPNGGSWTYDGTTYTTSKNFSGNYNAQQAIADPTRTGYDFSGWTLSSGANGSFNSSTKVYTFGPADGTTDTLTASWSGKTYTVSLDSKLYASAQATDGTAATTTGTASVTATYGSAMPSATMPTRTGYTFDGYYDGKTGTGNMYYKAAGGSNQNWNKTSNTTLYAKWTINTSTLTIKPNSGTWTYSGTSYTADKSFTQNYNTTITVPAPTRTGYTFTGWTRSGDNNGSWNATTGVYTFGATKGKTDILTAGWQINTSTLTVKPNGGTWTHSGTAYTADKSFTQNYNTTITIETPTRTGYDFGGWTLSNNANGSFTNGVYKFGAASGTTDTLTAQWTAKTFDISFGENGGTWKGWNSGASNTGTQKKTVTFASTFGAADSDGKTWPQNPTKTGYTFSKWTSDGTASGTTYTQTTNVTTEGPFTALAYYTINSSKLTIAPNGGSWSYGGTAYTANKSFTQNYNTTITIGAPTRTGYDFSGWTRGGSDNGSWNSSTGVFTFGATANTETTLTANWSIHTSTLQVNPNGGKWTYNSTEYTTTQSYTKNYNETMTIPAPTRTGYTFSGWTRSGDDNGTWNASTGVYTFGAAKNKTDVLTAGWTGIKYTVTLDQKLYASASATDGTAPTTAGTASVQATYGSAMPTTDLTLPTRTGYDFGGYWTGKTGTGTMYYTAAGASNGNWNIAQATTLYAKWTIHTSTLKVDPAGGTYNSTTSVTTYSNKQYGSTQTIADPTRTGYDFSGWTLSAGANGSFNSSTKVYTFGAASGTTDTLTANWTIHTSTLKVNPNSGTWTYGGTAYTTTQSFTKNYGQTLTIPDPTRIGYNFTGWSWTGDNNGSWNASTKVYTFGAGKSKTDTMTANWEAITYTVSLDSARYASSTAASGTAATSAGTTSVQATYNSAMPQINVPTLTGYDFGGYWDGKTGTGTQYYKTDGSSYRNWNKASNTTLYAKWDPHEYTLNYNLISGSYPTGQTNPSKYTIETATFTLVEPAKNGWTFTGWTGTNGTAPTTKTKNLKITQGSTGDRSFDANYDLITYTIKYYDEDGTTQFTNLNPTTYNVTSNNFTLPAPTKTGYDFAGWTGSNGTTAQTSVVVTQGTYGDLSYTAHWTANKFTVTLNRNGGTTGSTKVENVYYNSAMPTSGVTMPTRAGYTFLGYFKTAQASDASHQSTKYYNANGTSAHVWDQTAASPTIYAHWDPTAYSITFVLNDDTNAPAALDPTSTANPLSYNITSSGSLPGATRGGYTFLGWKPNANANSWSASTTYPAGETLNGKYGNPTLTAQWQTESYTITFDMVTNGGTLQNFSGNTLTYTVETTDKTLPSASKTGHNFSGWKPTADVGSWLAASTYTAGTSVQGKWGTVTLRPQFTAKTFRLTFSLDGGSLTAGNGFSANTDNQYKTVTYGKTYNLENGGKSWPNNPTKTGYTFGGWMKPDGVTIVAGTDTVDITQNTTITAKWNAITYTLEYDLVGGALAAGQSNPPSYTVESEDITLNNPTRAGYDFLGWTGKNGTAPTTATTSLTIPQGSTGNRSFVANWNAKTYNLTYYDEDGTTVLTGLSPATYKITTATFNLPVPSKAGYNFKGWTGMGVTTATNPFQIPQGTYGDQTFTAHWTAKTYTVTLDRNGGTTGSTSVTATYNAAMPTTDVTMPTKNGYTFLGYYATAQSSDANHASTKYYNANGTSAHVWDQTAATPTIYAHWSETEFTITYNLDGGSVTPANANPTTYKISSPAITLVNPTKRGYNFTGWTGTGISQSMTVTIPTGSYGNRTFNATYSAITYTIEYDLKGGTASPANPTSFNVNTPDFTLTNPTKGGYLFVGWSGDANTGLSGTNNKPVTIAQGSIGNRKYTANWQAEEYTLTFNRNGGASKAPLEYTPDDDYELGSTTRTGYTFTKWKVTSPDGNWEDGAFYLATDTVAGMYGDATLQAQWQINRYTLTIKPAGGMYNNTTNNTTVENDYNTELTIGAPTRTGYNFTGWTKTDGAGTYTANSDATTGGKFKYGAGNGELTAGWTAINYQIVYTYGVGEGSVTNPSTYTIEDEFTLNNPSKAGYTFLGWTGSNGTTAQTEVTIVRGTTGRLEFEAKWQAKTYTVELDRRGGTTGAQSVLATFGQAMPSATMPTRTGYTFAGYYERVNGAGKKYYNADGSSANNWDQTVTNPKIYAHWTATVYTITYVLGGGTVSPADANPTNFTIVSEDFTLVPPTRTGYTFAGWTGGGGNGLLESATMYPTIETGSYGDRTYTATWSTIPYSITCNLDGGHYQGTDTNPTTYNIETPDITLCEPIKGGYTFAGWSGNDATGLSGDTNTNVVIPQGSIGNRVYTAHWTPTRFTLTFDRNYGAAKADLQYDASESTQLGSTTRTGYTFTKWKVIEPDGNWEINALYNATDTVYGMYGNATLQAQWQINRYTLTINPNGGIYGATTNNTTAQNDYNYELAIGAPSRVGYDFTGWTKTSGEGTYTANADAATGGTFKYGAGNATLTAGWSIHKSTLVVNPNGGSYNGTTDNTTYSNKDYNSTQSIADPTRTGYTFNGWTLNAGSNGTFNPTTKIYTFGTEKGTTDILTAGWVAHTYTLTLDTQGGVSEDTSVLATYGSAMPSAEMPTREGYEFKGYYAERNGVGTKYYNANGSSAHNWDQTVENPTIYAYWVAYNYKLTFNPNGGWFDLLNGATGGFDTGAANRTQPQDKYVTFASTYGADWNGKTWPAAMTRYGYTFNCWKSGTTVFEPTDTVSITSDTILTADWIKRSFTLTYDMNGVTATAPGDDTLYYDNVGTYAAAPTDVVGGWTFRGWSVSATTTDGDVAGENTTIAIDKVNAWFGEEAVVANDYTKTLYAIWVKTLTGTFIDTTETQLSSVPIYNGATEGTIAAPLTQHAYSGWTTKGWATGTASDATPSTASTFTITEDTTYYGRYERTLTLTYDLNGANAAATNPTTDSVTQQMSAYNRNAWTNADIRLADAVERDGYTFAGWKIDSVTKNAGDNYTITANKTAVAQWNLSTFDVTIDPNEGTVSGISYYATGTTSGDVVTSGEITEETTLTMVSSTTATIPLPERNGYAFTRWDVTATSDGTVSQAWVTNSTTAASTYVVHDVDVTLTAVWTAKQYKLVYASGRGDGIVTEDGYYDYDATVTVKPATFLTDPETGRVKTYPGYTFNRWIASSDSAFYTPGSSFTLLGCTYAGNETVTLTAQWTASQYRIIYNLNGAYTTDDIVAAGSGSRDWNNCPVSTRLTKSNSSRTVTTYSAYSSDGDYFYLDTGDELRFGLTWSYKSVPESSADLVAFNTPLRIGNIPDWVLENATHNGSAVQYDITLYMVWSADYMELEENFALFQDTYMTFPEIEEPEDEEEEVEDPFVRGIRIDTPTSAMLPAVAEEDAAYKANGVRAKEIQPNIYAPDHGKYGWVPGCLGDPDTWDSEDVGNDFTAESIGDLNDEYLRIGGYLVLDPCGMYEADAILPQSSQSAIDSMAAELETACTDPEAEGGMLEGLKLQDVDLDYRLTDADLESFDTESIHYSDACASGAENGMSYKPDTRTKNYLRTYFGVTLENRYPECETGTNADGTTGHHSFNSLVGLIGKANAIFSTFGFTPEEPRSSTNIFRTGNTDARGYTINPNCNYTTESVYKLFDLIYGRADNSGVYRTSVSGNMNVGEVALYYQVKDMLGEDATTLLKKPSMQKLKEYMAMITYVYHSLELKDADYGQDLPANSNEVKFINLFQNYFAATWGPTLQAAGYSPNSPYLTTYQSFFTEESYSNLENFMRLYFSEPGRLLPNGDGVMINGRRTTFPYRKIVEQQCIDGMNPTNGRTREFMNESLMDELDNLDLSNFAYADGTLCDEFCDLIDALQPDTADYSEVFRLIARNAQRQADSTSYMIDYRSEEYDTETFYPSTAGAVNDEDNYDTWYEIYGNPDAWDSGEYNDHPAYDTEWLYRYYTEDSVNELYDVLTNIDWELTKLAQSDIDGMTNGQYNEGTFCYDLKYAIDHLVPKTYKVNFYKALSNDNSDFLEQVSFYLSNNGEEMPFRFGMTVTTTKNPDLDYSLHKTFIGWNTLRNNDAGHIVSDANNLYHVTLLLDETLLEEWWNNEQADITESADGTTYTIKLYARYVDNVTLSIDMQGGSAQMTVAQDEPVIVTNNMNNGPTYDYGTVLTFTNMTKEGYQFSGWTFTMGENNAASVWNDETNQYTFGYTRVMPKTNDTLRANWTKNTYTVTFHANDANAVVSTMDPQTFRYDTPQALTPNAFMVPGYRFLEWRTNADGTGTRYEDGQTVNNLTSVQNGNVDLYAIWELADFTLTFDVGDGEWSGWNEDATANTDTMTKIVTAESLYNKRDEDGKTWPVDPVESITVVGTKTIRSRFIGWCTDPEDPDNTLIDEANDAVHAVASFTVYAVYDTEITEETADQIEIAIEQMDANKYTMESMIAVDLILQRILDSGNPVTEQDKLDLEEAMNNLQPSDEAATGDVTPPVVHVYENKAALQAAIADGQFAQVNPDADRTQLEEDLAYMLSDNVGEVSYVFPGKAYYTYYCYTNSATPAIMMNSADIMGSNGRVSYPTTVSMDTTGKNSSGQPRTRTGLVYSGWMKYSVDADDSVRKADYSIGSNEIANPYRNELKYFGMDFSKGVFEGDTGYDFYTHQQYVLLKPQFDATNRAKQYALYTFTVSDDSYDQLAAGQTTLGGAENYGTYSTGVDLVSTNENISPTHTVTIFVEYTNTMAVDEQTGGYRADGVGQWANNGVGTYGPSGALEVYNKFHENGYQNNQWVSVDYLYRNAAGIANADFVTPMTMTNGAYTSYVANDPIYGQTDVGSFYYLLKPTDAAAQKYWEEYDKYIDEHPDDPDLYHNARIAGANAGGEESAMNLMKNQVIRQMKDPKVREQMNSTPSQAAQAHLGDYIYWPYTGSTQWSTQFYAPARTREETLVYVHIYDRWGNHFTNILQRDLQDTQAASASEISIGEVVINELGGSGIADITITELNTTKVVPVTISSADLENLVNSPNNQIMITVPEGKNGYRYTMTVTDDASNKYTFNFQADSSGNVWITLNDELMGGQYAAAAANPPQSQGGSVGIESIEQAGLATLSVQALEPEAIVPESENEESVEMTSEERPDVYTFTINQTYTVNLFADGVSDYEVTLKSTTGGTVDAYVNGEYAQPKSGKINVPGGSRVKIYVTPKTGYELESLMMIYPDGSTTNLVGAYNAAINDNVTIKAVFVETEALLTIRVENGAVSGKQEIFVSPYSRVTAVAEAAPDGKVFAYWTQVEDGVPEVPVSYDSIYTFIATSSMTLKAVYADEQVEQTANIVMDAASPTHVTQVNGAYSLAYSGKITLPEGAQIEEFGLVLTNQAIDSSNVDDFVIGGKVNGKNVAKIVGQTVTEEGQCKINVNNVAAGQTRIGRLFMTVRLADGTTQTIYSNTWSELNTPAA